MVATYNFGSVYILFIKLSIGSLFKLAIMAYLFEG